MNIYEYIKFQTIDVDNIEIPFGELLGGSNTDGYSCTLNGFTGARNGEMIPEWFVGKKNVVEPIAGAELHQVVNGVDKIIARFIKGHFVIESK